MATRTNRSRAGLLVCLADPLSDSRGWSARCAEASCESSDHVEDSIQEDRGAASPRRIPRFFFIGMRREEPADRPTLPDEISRPKKTPVMAGQVRKG